MVTVIRSGEAERLDLPGRTSWEIVSVTQGARAVTLRRVEIPVPAAGDAARGRHRHAGFEECIHVLDGEGITESDDGAFPVRAGDTILVPAGVMHATRNTGRVPLVLLCFFPVADIREGSVETPPTNAGAR